MSLSTLIIDSSHIGWGTATALILEFGIRVALVLMLLGRRGISPETRVTWIILILALPIIGVFLYLMPTCTGTRGSDLVFKGNTDGG